jgi:hypothetical protein
MVGKIKLESNMDAMAMIPLERRFIAWTDEDEGDPEILRHLLASREALCWDDLLAKHRVVILAEAGSGKSTEIAEQARRSIAAKRFTFAATMQNVGRRGLSKALGSAAAQQLDQWRSSDQPAWFFFDSVDEAKASDVRLEDVLREISDGIDGAAARAHIIITGRHTDWEFRRDLERLETWLAMPPIDLLAPVVDPNELIISVMRRDRPADPPPPAEKPLVVVMATLDRSQVEVFARGMGVTNVDAFFAALGKSNLWDFARRPLDLDWLVAYWRVHNGLGVLTEMLELSLRQRLTETDPERSRTDPIDTERAMAALERIGAALVLQGLRDIVVPDGALDLADGRPALNLSEILPDWSGDHRMRLVSRAVFDPASAGLARIHNDNEGSVRGFLTARWLHRLILAGQSRSMVADMLFRDSYGIALVIPSMRQTAAWLSLWSPAICMEVLRRDPRLLMDAGDPASLSLDVREEVLRAVTARVIGDETFDIPDRDSLRRFARPDIAPCLPALWAKHGGSPAVREMLLLMIWLGEIHSCADIAIGAAFGAHADRYTQIFSGRALMAAADTVEKRRYAHYVRDTAGSLLSEVVWDAIETLFPDLLSVEDFVAILRVIDVTHRGGGLGLEYLGPKLVERLGSVAQAESLLSGLFDNLEARLNPGEELELRKDEPLLSTIEAAGRRLLELTPQSQAPALAIDAALRLGETRRFRRQRHANNADVFGLLQLTPERRRAALWGAADRLANAKPLQGKTITNAWQIEMLGFSPVLRQDDFDWLIKDAECLPAANLRQVAIDSALQLWREGGKLSVQLARIRAAGAVHPEIAATIEEWTRPQSPSEEELAHRREMQRIDGESAAQSVKHDQSWRDFADRLRADPGQLRSIEPPTEKGVDARLYHLWKLLDAAGENQSRYAISDLSPLVPMLGTAVVDALQDAFVSYWRRWNPKLRSERDASNRNGISGLDCIGIVGVTQEAKLRPTWAGELTFDDAMRAAIYGTLELNGYPSWFFDLARAQPEAVGSVLVRSITPELACADETVRPDALEDISRAEIAISSLVAEHLFRFLSAQTDLPTIRLAPILRILCAAYTDKPGLASHLGERFKRCGSLEHEALYLGSLFKLDPVQATAALDKRLSDLPSDRQTRLVQIVLPKVFGRQGEDRDIEQYGIPFDVLERLVRIAFRTIRVEDDNDHPVGEAYDIDARDDAENARSALFKVLIDTPGLATFAAIGRLAADPDFPVPTRRMRELARVRAAQDAEPEAWSSADVHAFEVDSVTAPRNARDLQWLAVRKIIDLQHDLLNADYAQGATVARLPNEVDVQNWVADRLRGAQGRNYSIEREPHVVDEKEPDIRFRAKATDANVPMEIKVAESWTLDDLDEALVTQLIGRYLRDRDSRWGILLVVNQSARPQGWWSNEDGAWLTFDQVMSRLRDRAYSIAAASPNAPQVEIAVIDVTSAATDRGSKAKASGNRQQKVAEISSAPQVGGGQVVVTTD